jgi:hypothetical protein
MLGEGIAADSPRSSRSRRAGSGSWSMTSIHVAAATTAAPSIPAPETVTSANTARGTTTGV